MTEADEVTFEVFRRRRPARGARVLVASPGLYGRWILCAPLDDGTFVVHVKVKRETLDAWCDEQGHPRL